MDLNEFQALRYQGIEISRTGIASVYGARVNYKIAREEIWALAIKRGHPGERRWLQLVISILLLGWVAVLALDLLLWLVRGGTRFTHDLVAPLFLASIGGWLLWDVLRPQWYLEIQLQEKTRKLAFDFKLDRAQLDLFLTTAGLMGYSIDASALPPIPPP
jgi:hypothetical protein